MSRRWCRPQGEDAHGPGTPLPGPSRSGYGGRNAPPQVSMPRRTRPARAERARRQPVVDEGCGIFPPAERPGAQASRMPASGPPLQQARHLAPVLGAAAIAPRVDLDRRARDRRRPAKSSASSQLQAWRAVLSSPRAVGRGHPGRAGAGRAAAARCPAAQRLGVTTANPVRSGPGQETCAPRRQKVAPGPAHVSSILDLTDRTGRHREPHKDRAPASAGPQPIEERHRSVWNECRQPVNGTLDQPNTARSQPGRPGCRRTSNRDPGLTSAGQIGNGFDLSAVPARQGGGARSGCRRYS